MQFQRAKITNVRDGLFLIDDAGDSTAYLICGKDRALIVDTLNGYEDLQMIARTLTDLPLTVVNTHGHPDHILCNVNFDEAWIHPADREIAEGFFAEMGDLLKKEGLTPCPFRELAPSQLFDLGGITLETIHLPGHTPGSVALLCREMGILFTGDAILPQPWIQLEHSLSIRTYRDSLAYLLSNYARQFDTVFHGHARGPESRLLVSQLLTAAEEMLQGRTENDKEYLYFDGQAKALFHPFSGEKRVGIVYTEKQLAGE